MQNNLQVTYIYEKIGPLWAFVKILNFALCILKYAFIKSFEQK